MGGLSPETAAGPALDFVWSALPAPEASRLESVPETPQLRAAIADYEAELAEGLEARRRAAIAAAVKSTAAASADTIAEVVKGFPEELPSKNAVLEAAPRQAQRPRGSEGYPVGAVPLSTPQTDAAVQARSSERPAYLGVDVRKRVISDYGTVRKPLARNVDGAALPCTSTARAPRLSLHFCLN